MTRHDLILKWETIQRLQESPDATERARALALIDDLSCALAGKVLVLDDGTALLEENPQSGFVVLEVFNDPV